MATLKNIEKVVLFVGVIYSGDEHILKIEKILQNKYGKILFISEDFSFNKTSYYLDEMGENLHKKFFAFEKLISQDALASVKLFTNKIEADFSVGSARTVNLDPGYLNFSKVVLASCKDFAHRIYIGRQIFAEITLSYSGNKFSFLPWTYPDYKSPEYLDFFYKLRDWYKKNTGIHFDECTCLRESAKAALDKLPFDYKTKILAMIDKLKINLNTSEEIIENLKDIYRKEGTRLDEIFDFETTDNVRKFVKKKRFPILNQKEEEFEKFKKLVKARNITLKHFPYFEKQEYEVNIKFKDVDELRKWLEEEFRR